MKDYFRSSIQYYLRHLYENGCLDPVREITTDFTSYLNEYITDNQKKYIEDNINKEANENIVKDIIVLVRSLQGSRKVDKETLLLIEKSLKSLL